jgi:glucose/arabinose dehydrogenase
LQAELIMDGLTQPVHVTAAPLDPHRLFIVEQRGQILIWRDGLLLASPFLSIRGKVFCGERSPDTPCGGGDERGLLSMAFHPNFEENGWFFVNYTNNSSDTVVARYSVSAADPDRADPDSERILFTVDQPFSNHNGGQVAFGPDGFLYVGMGDGGGRADPLEASQDDERVLGKMLRLDVDVAGAPYFRVPDSNPNPKLPGLLGLIWAKGLRNPWRFSFDRDVGDLYIADVGQNRFEEIDVQPAGSTGGENYGWDIFEASTCFEPEPLFADCPDPPTAFVHPVLEYGRTDGVSVTGGFVYRGCALPDLSGTYFYADFGSAFIRSFELVGGAALNQQDWTAELGPGSRVSIRAIASFGEDARGEIYIVDRGGEIFKIVGGAG